MADLAEAILGKVAEVLRANQLQKALQLLQDMAKSNQALTVKHMAKLADSMGMRSLGLEICNGRCSTCWLGMNWTQFFEHEHLIVQPCALQCCWPNPGVRIWALFHEKEWSITTYSSFKWLKGTVYCTWCFIGVLLSNWRFWVSHLISFQNIV